MITKRYVLTAAYNKELMGFFTVTGNSVLCKIVDIDGCIRTAVCAISIDLSTITGLNQNIFSGTGQSKTFNVNHMYCGPSSGIEYQVIYTPSSATPNLISLSPTTSKTIVFAQSTNPSDAQIYTVIVNARLVGKTDWLTLLATANATFIYINPCLSASLNF
jgi:hypothetical protein